MDERNEAFEAIVSANGDVRKLSGIAANQYVEGLLTARETAEREIKGINEAWAKLFLSTIKETDENLHKLILICQVENEDIVSFVNEVGLFPDEKTIEATLGQYFEISENESLIEGESGSSDFQKWEVEIVCNGVVANYCYEGTDLSGFERSTDLVLEFE